MISKILKITAIVIALLFLILLLTVFFLWLSTAGYRLDERKLRLEEATAVFLDANNEVIPRNSAGAIPLADLPKWTPQAFLSVEDQTFYEHHGVNYRRIIGAAVKNLMSFRFKEGGSTISQQLIKNTHLSNEKTIRRKFAELRLTRELEKKYSKDQILELYLNSIYFGTCGYGIGNAARGIFGKSASELSLAESAGLAGLIRSPSLYSPYEHPDRFLSRRNLVLKLMFQQERIDEEAYQNAITEPLQLTDGADNPNLAYLNAAIDECETILHREERDWSGHRLIIRTSMQPELQKTVQNVAKTQIETSEYYANIDKSIVVLENQTGAVLAFSSSDSFAFRRNRQPASAIKPLLVYAPALERELIEPATILKDQKQSIDGFSPSNYHDKYYGDVTARFAVANSLNIPAVRLLADLGVDRAMEYLRRNGFSVSSEDLHLAAALGGFCNGFSLPTLANGYATLARNGEYRPLSFLRSVEMDGKVVYDAERSTRNLPRPVFSPQTAFLTLDMLRDCVSSGTAKALRPLAIPLAAKTGTNGNAEGNLDAYCVSVNPTYTVAAWVGSDQRFSNQISGGTLPTQGVKSVWESLKTRSACEDFSVPDGVYRQTVDAELLKRDGKFVLADELAPREVLLSDYFRRPILEQSQRFQNPTVQNLKVLQEDQTLSASFDTEIGFSYEVYDLSPQGTLSLGTVQGDGSSHSVLTSALTGSHRIRVIAVYLARNIRGTPCDSEEFRMEENFVPGPDFPDFPDSSEPEPKEPTPPPPDSSDPDPNHSTWWW